MAMTEAEKEAWLKDWYPTLDLVIQVMELKAPERSEGEQRLMFIVARLNNIVSYLIEKKTNLEVENNNLKDLLAAIDRRG